MLVVRFMEDNIRSQRRTEDKKKQPPGQDSPVEEGVEDLLRFQGKQLQRSGASVAHDSRRKGSGKWGQVRRSDSCHLDSLFQRISHFFRCQRQIQLCQVLRWPSFQWGMDQHRGWPAARGICNDLLHLHRREESVLHQELKALRV